MRHYHITIFPGPQDLFTTSSQCTKGPDARYVAASRALFWTRVGCSATVRINSTPCPRKEN